MPKSVTYPPGQSVTYRPGSNLGSVLQLQRILADNWVIHCLITNAKSV